ncbi:hypothetical protein DY000_02017510 [Brassica cretica]|uniref:Neprosin domain-containing protein n=1 Tax=Brassica cretica TaxID=69181 RepID=A0ABQ7DAC6_BRACR|nr:hypothetical protein DY000_02017510 [Brassica cretica]
MDSFRSYYVGQIFRTSHGFGDYWLAYQGGSEDGGSCLAQRWGLEHGESRVVWAGRRVWLKALTSDSSDVSIEAPPAINTSHVKAESNKNGTGFVELMGRYSDYNIETEQYGDYG